MTVGIFVRCIRTPVLNAEVAYVVGTVRRPDVVGIEVRHVKNASLLVRAVCASVCPEQQQQQQRRRTCVFSIRNNISWLAQWCRSLR